MCIGDCLTLLLHNWSSHFPSLSFYSTLHLPLSLRSRLTSYSEWIWHSHYLEKTNPKSPLFLGEKKNYLDFSPSIPFRIQFSHKSPPSILLPSPFNFNVLQNHKLLLGHIHVFSFHSCLQNATPCAQASFCTSITPLPLFPTPTLITLSFLSNNFLLLSYWDSVNLPPPLLLCYHNSVFRILYVKAT